MAIKGAQQTLVKQLSLLPMRKVGMGGIGGSAVVVIVWIASALGIAIPAEVTVAIGALATFATAYMTRERA